MRSISTSNLYFRDDFFAAIRAIYNERATDPSYQRLTFALFGVATPTDLIEDRERTPFNIGRRIDLREFTLADAQPLRDGLVASFPARADQFCNEFSPNQRPPLIDAEALSGATYSSTSGLKKTMSPAV